MSEEQRPLLLATELQRRRSEYANTIFQRMRRSCVAILLTVALERLAFYSIIDNLVLFLNKDPYHWMVYNALSALFLFTALCYISTLLSGWLADSYIGRYKCIVGSFVLYIIGYALLPLLGWKDDKPAWWCCTQIHNASSSSDTDINPWSESCAWAVYASLVVIAVGCGGVKVNIAAFGADQVRKQSVATTRGFFNWYYWSVNVGALVALGGVAYVQQNVNFFYGYLIPCLATVLAMFAFLLGTCWYDILPSGRSGLCSVMRVITDACRRGLCCVMRQSYSNINSSSSSSQYYSAAPPSTSPPTHHAGCLEPAKISNGGRCSDSLVSDVAALLKIGLVLMSMIPYWLIYFQMCSTFLLQGLHLRLSLSTEIVNATAEDGPNSQHTHHNMQITAAWLTIFNVLFVILVLPLMDRVVYPYLDRRGYTMSLRMRIIIGMATAIVAVVLAGVLEHVRLSVYWQDGIGHPYNQTISGTVYQAADLSIFYQIPQYALIGVSEVFASIAALEFSNVNAPPAMRSMIMSLFWTVQGIASILGTALIYAFKGMWFFHWDTGDINCRIACPHDPSRVCHACHLDYYFYVLAGIGGFGLACFYVVTHFVKLQFVHPRSGNNAPSQTRGDAQCRASPDEATRAEEQHTNGASIMYSSDSDTDSDPSNTLHT